MIFFCIVYACTKFSLFIIMQNLTINHTLCTHIFNLIQKLYVSQPNFKLFSYNYPSIRSSYSHHKNKKIYKLLLLQKKSVYFKMIWTYTNASLHILHKVPHLMKTNFIKIFLKITNCSSYKILFLKIKQIFK